MRRTRRLLRSTVQVPAYLALTVALLLGITGTATAGRLVTGSDIKDGTITSKDVKDKSLQVSDLSGDARNQLRGARGPEGKSSLSPLPKGTFVVGGGGFGMYDVAGQFVDAVTALGIRTTKRLTDAGSGRNVWFGAPFTLTRDDGENASKCAGTAEAPTAARGQLCIYLLSTDNLAGNTVIVDPGVSTTDDVAEFGQVVVRGQTVASGHTILRFVWAYTAP